MEPKGAREALEGAWGAPGRQKERKGSQKGAKREPKGAKREPKVSQIQHKINIKERVAKK